MERRDREKVRHTEAHDGSARRLPPSGRTVRANAPQKRPGASPPQKKNAVQAKVQAQAKPPAEALKKRPPQAKQSAQEHKKVRPPAGAEQRGAQPSKRPPGNGAVRTARPTAKQPVKKVKRPLTPEQKAKLEARRRAREEARKRMLKRLGAVLLVFLTCYTVISLVTATLMWVNFNRVSRTDIYYVAVYSPKKNPESKKEKEKKLAECPASDANIDGSLYISYTALSSLGEIGMVGDTSGLTVVFRDSGDVACFTAFSTCITVNGIPASLSAPVVRTGNEYWFPVEFLQKYMSGITVTKGSDGDGVPMCKVMLSEYGGIPSLKNHSDYGTDGVSEPEYSQDDSGE